MEKHSIALSDGRVISSGGEGISIGSVKLTQNVNSGTELTPGSVFSMIVVLLLICPVQKRVHIL